MDSVANGMPPIRLENDLLIKDTENLSVEFKKCPECVSLLTALVVNRCLSALQWRSLGLHITQLGVTDFWGPNSPLSPTTCASPAALLPAGKSVKFS